MLENSQKPHTMHVFCSNRCGFLSYLLFIRPPRTPECFFMVNSDGCRNFCAALPWVLLIDAALRCIVLVFCPTVNWSLGYGWQGTVWADRCLGRSCWAGLVLTGWPGWMDPCSRDRRGGGPKSRLEPSSESVVRRTKCQVWQSRHPHLLHHLPSSPKLSLFVALLTFLTPDKTAFWFLFVTLFSCSALWDFKETFQTFSTRGLWRSYS